MACKNCNCEKCINYFTNKYLKKNPDNKKLSEKIIIYTDDKKLCSRCKKYKDLDKYDSNGKSFKKRSECKTCRKKTNRETYLKRRAKKNYNKVVQDIKIFSQK